MLSKLQCPHLDHVLMPITYLDKKIRLTAPVSRQSLQSLLSANMVKISFLVLLVLTSAFGEETRIECPEAEVAYGGAEYWLQTINYITSWEDCGRACAITWNCNFWTWDLYETNEDWCILYETDIGLHYDPNYISGERGCPEDQGCKEKCK